jgi:hypothetical protein
VSDGHEAQPESRERGPGATGSTGCAAGVRNFQSVAQFLEVNRIAGDYERLVALLMFELQTRDVLFDPELHGGRYFIAGPRVATKRTRWAVLEAQPSGRALLTTRNAKTNPFTLRRYCAWLSEGPHPEALSAAGRQLLEQLADAGRDGVPLHPEDAPEPPEGHLGGAISPTALPAAAVSELRSCGFTVDLLRATQSLVLHTPWNGHSGAWPEDWQIIRRTGEHGVEPVAEGLTRQEALLSLTRLIGDLGSVDTFSIEDRHRRTTANNFLAAGGLA